MAKVRIHELAKDLGIASKELLFIAQTLGYAVETHANTLEEHEAEELKATILGLASVGFKPESEPGFQPSMETFEVNQQKQPSNALMLVNMGKQDVRLSKHGVVAFDAMVKVCAALLADPKQTLRIDHETVPWGSIYFLRADRSTPMFGYIELEYGDETYGSSQRQKGVLGDLLWSARWINEYWTRPFEKLAMSIGLTRDPEADYRNQFESDLRALEARGLIDGLIEWEITTGIPGRNIYIYPKDEEYEHHPNNKL
ncbi:MAG TPA: hypothetical protein DCE42_00920 [Myxococcales bacterium]|nr:hypothetical protein [Deltaproteobacteria bacterium]MBU54241.1 hypothetical protein [Deltaproteobacteria bacterium]HAA53282.1 hypothetical protein [Myxococcales bacterium]|tara:strand:+ start:2034 stop:2801 length:768 start_codon:yes stop_codon:yes gene_type:complete